MPDVFLRAGYSASGDIILERKNGALSVNERDITIENDTTYIEVETSEQVFERRIIETGLSDGILIEIVSGVDSTDKVKVVSDDIQ